jgi:hypothetical protein
VHVRFAEDARIDGDRLLAFVRETRGAKLSPARVLSAPSPAGDAVVYDLATWLSEMSA